MENPDGRRASRDANGEPNTSDGRERADVPPEDDPTAEGATEEVPVEDAAEDGERNGTGGEGEDLDEFRKRLEA